DVCSSDLNQIGIILNIINWNPHTPRSSANQSAVLLSARAGQTERIMMSSTTPRDTFGARASFDGPDGPAQYYRLAALEERGVGQVSRLPFSIKVLLEAALRNNNGFEIADDDVVHLAQWSPQPAKGQEIPFNPARVILQDF